MAAWRRAFPDETRTGLQGLQCGTTKYFFRWSKTKGTAPQHTLTTWGLVFGKGTENIIDYQSRVLLLVKQEGGGPQHKLTKLCFLSTKKERERGHSIHLFSAKGPQNRLTKWRVFETRRVGPQQRLTKWGFSLSVRNRKRKGATALTNQMGACLSGKGATKRLTKWRIFLICETRSGRATAKLTKCGFVFAKGDRE